MTDALQELGTHLEMKRTDCILSWEVTNDELTVTIAPSSVVSFIEFLKTDGACQFSSLVDITAVDYPARSKRFDVIYHFLSMYQNHRIRLRVQIREDDMVPSIIDIHPSSNWFE
ncbi:MAG: NADH-quinone oxidoreductase subunit C, partial [Yoonia sp.]